MKLLKGEQDLIANVAARWKEQYYCDGRWTSWLRGNPNLAQTVYDQLVAIGPTASRTAVVQAIGNDTWITPEACTECEQPAIIQLGEELDIESRTVFLCEACLREAVRLAEESAEA